MSGIVLVLDHLWQSTLVVTVIAVLALALRRKHAGIRHALWLAASVKFLVPFALLSSLGAAIGARLPAVVPDATGTFLADVVSAPIAATEVFGAAARSSLATGLSDSLLSWPVVLAIAWAGGTLLLVAVWILRWTRVVRMAGQTTRLESGREVGILRRLEASMGMRRAMRMLASDSSIEPGVFGLFRPVLIWPHAMGDRLTDTQVETILLHEIGHVRRYDNLTAVVHGIVQAVFWFHPLVWWIGARLMHERERACDELVVRMGRDRQAYAEGLLKTCQFCVEAPVSCLSGVTGADLKRRVTTIMTAQPGVALGPAMAAFLVVMGVAVLAAPLVAGAAAVPQVTGTGLSLPDSSRTFEAASVRQNTSGVRGSSSQWGDGRMTMRNMSLAMILQQAFQVRPAQVVDAPGWFETDRFDLVARARATDPDTDARTTQQKDADLRVMLQNFLIERFAMKLRVETRDMPIYALVLAGADGRLGPDLIKAECETYSSGPGPCGTGPAVSGAAGGHGGGGGGIASVGARQGGGPGTSTMGMQGLTMPVFAQTLSRTVGRVVVDRTGLTDRFDLTLRYANPMQLGSGDSADVPELFTALQEQLGLKLEATRGPVEVLAIEAAQHPVNDDFVMPEPERREIPPPPQ